MNSIINVLIGVDPSSQIMAGIAPTPLKRIAIDLSQLNTDQRRTLTRHLWPSDASIRQELTATCPPVVFPHPASTAMVVEWLDSQTNATFAA